MSLEHLSDKQVQAYLDAGCPGGSEVSDHLDVCRECRKLVSEYQAVFSALGDETEFALSEKFTDATMAKIKAFEAPADSIERSFFWLWTGVAASCLIAAWFLIGGERIAQTLKAIIAWDPSWHPPRFFTILQELYAQSPSAFSLLLWAGLIIVGAAIVDKIVHQRSTSKAHLVSI
ncbi:MAG: hypothetical protein KAU36_10195 [candidate division Zixibacteria bacterium]|nr:hypothetical protein [candidate division Zixibacteria bacterium]